MTGFACDDSLELLTHNHRHITTTTLHAHNTDTMAKSARASVTKKNNQALKRKVFGPAETARNDRMNAKLLELAQQPKPPRAEMEVEQEGMQHNTGVLHGQQTL